MNLAIWVWSSSGVCDCASGCGDSSSILWYSTQTRQLWQSSVPTAWTSIYLKCIIAFPATLHEPSTPALCIWEVIGQQKVSAFMNHYNDVIMSAMASQITSLTIVYSTVHSGADKKNPSKLSVTGLLWGEFTGDLRIPRTKGQWRGKCLHFMTSSWWEVTLHLWRLSAVDFLAYILFDHFFLVLSSTRINIRWRHPRFDNLWWS